MKLSHAILFPLIVFGQTVIAGAPTEASAKTRSAEEAARIVADVPLIWRSPSPMISPDGKTVVYSVMSRSFATNEAIIEVFVQRIPAQGEALLPPIKLPKDAKAVQWHPDGRSLSMLIPKAAGSAQAEQFVLFDHRSGTVAPLTARTGAATAGEMPQISEFYIWSPRGNYIAFTAPPPNRAKPDESKGVLVPIMSKSEDRLYIYEVGSGKTRQLQPQFSKFPFSVDDPRRSASWAPDEKAIAVTLTQQMGLESDIAVIDIATGKSYELVSRVGIDAVARWSPDGKWIAFKTTNGVMNYHRTWAAAVSAVGGEIVAFPVQVRGLGAQAWSSDSNSFYLSAGLEMQERVVRFGVSNGEFAPIREPVVDLEVTHFSNQSLSRDSRTMVYTQESVDSPAELYVTALDVAGNPVGQPRRLTSLVPNFPLRGLVRTEKLSWRSRDGKFTIHGMLTTPAAAWRNDRLEGPLPTLLHAKGGPSMVDASFNDHYAARVAHAVRGYAVLSPNTRGRSGYGESFTAAIADGRSRYRLGLEDALAGIDVLVQRGVADPARLGVYGHSYGGSFTGFTITYSNRFKAAIINEGSSINGIAEPAHIGYARGTWHEVINRDLNGMHDPYDRADRERAMLESPLFNVDRVRTPTLMIYGEKSHPAGSTWAQQPFFAALRRFNVPSAFFIYREEGHGFRKPVAIADALTREGEWLDYWVRGKPFPNKERMKEYLWWQAESVSAAAK